LKTGKALYILLIALFIILNYYIISVGHKLTYNFETNKCTHMSSQLEGMFESVGIPVTLKVGSRNNNSSHMWISLWNVIDIDSKSLFPFSNGDCNINRVDYVSYGDYENR